MSKLEKVKEFIGSLPSDVKVHMSKKPLSGLKNFTQQSGHKPRGLWYDCEKEWMNWISSEMPDWVGDYIYLIKLNKSVILKLDNPFKIMHFTDEYLDAPPNWPAFMGMSNFSIDWKRVSQKYAGVEICPYQWELRMNEKTGWYYTWDVASGCIWNPIGVDVKFVGMWDESSQEVISKDEIINGDNVIARGLSGLNWYKRSTL